MGRGLNVSPNHDTVTMMVGYGRATSGVLVGPLARLIRRRQLAAGRYPFMLTLPLNLYHGSASAELGIW
jgi:hypothetical protein